MSVYLTFAFGKWFYWMAKMKEKWEESCGSEKINEAKWEIDREKRKRERMKKSEEEQEWQRLQKARVKQRMEMLPKKNFYHSLRLYCLSFYRLLLLDIPFACYLFYWWKFIRHPSNELSQKCTPKSQAKKNFYFSKNKKSPRLIQSKSNDWWILTQTLWFPSIIPALVRLTWHITSSIMHCYIYQLGIDNVFRW